MGDLVSCGGDALEEAFELTDADRLWFPPPLRLWLWLRLLLLPLLLLTLLELGLAL